ncbi:pyridoxamine 5'-phosphate oxidase family protein [Nocardia jiangsuensis]|uniref:Pyridoxamine 5'-phosphate oxidase family protein n=1 Tax=Nocardia jiangsuensis TaxID=1691563 RepID=A0ABV8DX39_9NOCA
MTSSVVDTDTEFGARVAERLDSDQPNPVWFLWSDGTLLIFSKPDQAEVRNIRRNPRVSLHLDSTSTGGGVVVFTGTAHLEEVPPGAAETGALLAKYEEGAGEPEHHRSGVHHDLLRRDPHRPGPVARILTG